MRSQLQYFEHLDPSISRVNGKKSPHVMGVYAYVPDGIDLFDSIVVFSLSGCLRNASDYCRQWIPYADAHGYIVLAPEFDKGSYSIWAHEYGNMVTPRCDYASQDPYTPYMWYPEELNPEEDWIFHNIPEIFEELAEEIGYDTSRGYVVYGHSSGCQLAHRMMLFGGNALDGAKLFLLANAGQWTCADFQVPYPNGIKNIEFDEFELYRRALFACTCDAVVLSGSEDLSEHYLNAMPDDIRQGKNRVQRARRFFESWKVLVAPSPKISFSWHFRSVDGAGHDSVRMLPAAVEEIEARRDKLSAPK